MEAPPICEDCGHWVTSHRHYGCEEAVTYFDYEMGIPMQDTCGCETHEFIDEVDESAIQAALERARKESE